MIHALVLGLVIAIILIILIQKTTSGFTAAECDARYTLDYRTCNDQYEKRKRACRGRNQESCKGEALKAKKACVDAAAAAKITCLGPAVAAGDVVATNQLRDAQRRDKRRSSPATVTGAARVTPGSTLTPSAPQGRQGGQGGQGNKDNKGNKGNKEAGTPVAPPVAAPPPAPTAPPAPTPPPVAAPPPAPTPPPVAAPPPAPAPAEAPSALQMAECSPGDTAKIFAGQKSGEALAGGSATSLREGDEVCSKPAPGAYQCDFGAGYAYHGGASISECVKPRTA